jgi:hypothetical protein
LTVALLAALAIGLSVTGVGRVGHEPPVAQAQEDEAEEQRAIMISEQLCAMLLIGLNNVPLTEGFLRCVSPSSTIKSLAGWIAMSDGKDTPIFNTFGDRTDVPCDADTNDDGELCGPGDFGVDDETEVRSLIDMRDDGLDDGVYRLRSTDFSTIDLEANQLHEMDGHGWLFVFPEDDSPITFRTSTGTLDRSQGGGGTAPASVDCGATPNLPVEFFEEDCDDDGVPEDGAVAVRLVPTPGDRGAGQVFIVEENEETVIDFTVVGELDRITFTPLKTSAMAGTDEDDCTFDLSVAGVSAALANPNLAIVLVHVEDSDGTQITAALLEWEVELEDVAFTFLPQTPTVDLGAFGKGFPQAICGGEEPGVTTVTAFTAQAALDTIDPFAQDEKASLDITVVGEPASITATVTPAVVTCDGVATAEVAATVADSAGNPVVDGVDVRFDVQVLGTTNPIVANTGAGVAKSTITPLAGVDTGVPVVITAGDVQTSILVQCGVGSAPPPPPAGGGTGGQPTGPGGTIQPPDTGSGGYRDASDAGIPWWPALPVVTLFALLAGARALAPRLRR